MKGITTIIFDLGGVLMDLDKMPAYGHFKPSALKILMNI